jgi:sulfur carrier protein
VVKVLLRNPRREVEVDGPITVHALLRRFELSPETVLVIVGEELVTHDVKLADDASVEIRPVISGGDGAQPCSDERDGGAESTEIAGDGAQPCSDERDVARGGRW